MDDIDSTDSEGELTTSEGESPAPSREDWELAFRVLGERLARDGSISTVALRRELEKKAGITDARSLVVGLTFFNRDSAPERGFPVPDFKFHHLGRSFYSEEEAEKHEAETIEEAEEASLKVSTVLPAVRRTYRQDEARLVTYVKRALEEIYASEFGPEENDFVFDVHNARKGGSFENVDVVAVHWRPHNICELITVEVKLEFSAQAVQQALNYARASHRTWIAVVVDSDSQSELPQRDPSLFEYAISRGLGVLGCHRRQGRAYDVFPIHWPLRNQPDPVEEAEFHERYRDELERAGAIEPDKRRFPRFR